MIYISQLTVTAVSCFIAKILQNTSVNNLKSESSHKKIEKKCISKKKSLTNKIEKWKYLKLITRPIPYCFAYYFRSVRERKLDSITTPPKRSSSVRRWRWLPCLPTTSFTFSGVLALSMSR